MYWPMMSARARRFSRDRWMLPSTLRWLMLPRQGPREDAGVEGECLGAEDAVVDVPYRIDQEDQHRLVRMERLRRGNDLSGKEPGHERREPEDHSGDDHQEPPEQDGPVLELLHVVVPVTAGGALLAAEVG